MHLRPPFNVMKSMVAWSMKEIRSQRILPEGVRRRKQRSPMPSCLRRISQSNEVGI
jgi:hypothetical protein